MGVHERCCTGLGDCVKGPMYWEGAQGARVEEVLHWFDECMVVCKRHCMEKERKGAQMCKGVCERQHKGWGDCTRFMIDATWKLHGDAAWVREDMRTAHNLEKENKGPYRCTRVCSRHPNCYGQCTNVR